MRGSIMHGAVRRVGFVLGPYRCVAGFEDRVEAYGCGRGCLIGEIDWRRV